MKCTVIISTLDHQETLNYSVPSVLAQTHENLELIVIGDGAPPRTNEIMARWCREDSRIKYLPFPKGEGHGELYRDNAIRESSGEFIFYLGDDDLWLENHVSTLLEYLTIFDFVNSIHTGVTPEGDVKFLSDQLALKSVRSLMINEKWNFFGPTCVAHTKEAYCKLPTGWNPRPEGMWSDLHMWRQWLSQPWLRCFTIPEVTTLHFPSPLRLEMRTDERASELEKYLPKLTDSAFVNSVKRKFEETTERASTKRELKDHSQFKKIANNRDQLKIKNESLSNRYKNQQKRTVKLNERISSLNTRIESLKAKNKKMVEANGRLKTKQQEQRRK